MTIINAGKDPPGGIWGLSVVSLIPLAVAVLHAFHPRIAIDDVTFRLLVLAALPWIVPWLASFVHSLKGPGGLELVFKEAEAAKKAAEEAKGTAEEAKGTAEEAKGTAEEAKGTAQEARGAAESADRKAELGAVEFLSPQATPHLRSAATPSAEARKRFDELAEEYVDIRGRLRSSSARTTAMARIVQQVVALAPKLDSESVDEALSSDHWGKRVCAYAYLYAQPTPALLGKLIQALASEPPEHAFGQYWGIRAIGRILSDRTVNSEMVVEPLRVLLAKLTPGTDRHYELTRILGDLGRQGA
jgi:hypothetical protein